MNFYFYDLETTGLDPFKDRIMQFGGLKLDDDLQPAGELEEFYVKLSEDILPNPEAVVLHGILPQTANLEGLSEYQFLNWLESEVYPNNPVFGGYNTANFDNQFMRWLHWRNFAPEAPMLKPSASFDVYKLLRLTADLRPEGLAWPKAAGGGRRSLTLGALAEANQIKRDRLHSAGGDVEVTAALARLIKGAQPKLFNHFLKLLKPDFVSEIVGSDNQPFVYNHYNNLASGASTTLAAVLAEHPTRVGCFIVYDLRQDVAPWRKLSAYDLSLRLKRIGPKHQLSTPFSILDINYSPVVAPAKVLDAAAAERLSLDKGVVGRNWHELQAGDLAKTAAEAYLQLANDSQSSGAETGFEAALARTKLTEEDDGKRLKLRTAKPDEIADLDLKFADPRLKQLQLLYQARNFPKTLKIDQLFDWEQYREQVFAGGKPSGLDVFRRQLRRHLMQRREDPEVINLLEELQTYVENILPEKAAG